MAPRWKVAACLASVGLGVGLGCTPSQSRERAVPDDASLELRSGANPRVSALGVFYSVEMFADGRLDLQRFPSDRHPVVHRLGSSEVFEALYRRADALLDTPAPGPCETRTSGSYTTLVVRTGEVVRERSRRACIDDGWAEHIAVESDIRHVDAVAAWLGQVNPMFGKQRD